MVGVVKPTCTQLNRVAVSARRSSRASLVFLFAFFSFSAVEVHDAYPLYGLLRQQVMGPEKPRDNFATSCFHWCATDDSMFLAP